MKFDYLVIGAGISGAAAAFELAQSGSVALIEAEAMPGYHSTGRSAALYTRNYGAPVVQRINAASHDFFINPPSGFAERPLVTPRGALTVATPGDEDKLNAILALSSEDNRIEAIPASRVLELAPLLRPECVSAAAYEPGVMDMDVDALHQGYLRGLRQRGGSLFCNARIDKVSRKSGLWRASAGEACFEGRVVVNAAGAWADQVGALAGTPPLGLVPKRRTAILVDEPRGLDTRTLPSVEFVDGEAYLKPDAGKIMASPGDQTPVEPQDIQPEEWDMAVLVDWLERRTLISVRRIANSWAGLRTFAADGVPVAGFDPGIEDFFWLAGQGGFGIMMAPTLGRIAAGLITDGRIPWKIAAQGLSEQDLSVARFSRRNAESTPLPA
ncbi:NAD(P)/FAD-dependent oxidoreductase [Microvirga alba]|uniref:FAD-binding oxidoreductase n=1 Tax=Microvirga alba TaxID=2791025 RepID=A0A931BVL7_9HYPH|nr:FAD-dependent oxidoreductase [Microvirga alba]MBF9235533.1 FAD-binding oxidoreductase [Microvirga alba]